jgi:hypothetical protein
MIITSFRPLLTTAFVLEERAHSVGGRREHPIAARDLRYRGQIQSVSVLAIISASCAIFNPAVVHILFRLLGLP